MAAGSEKRDGSAIADAAASADVQRWDGIWYVVPWQVIFRDVDAFGHVNNAVYLTYFEWARAQLWFSLTGGSGPSDIGFIVARAECDFIAQIGMERIDIRVRIGEMRNSSFDTFYEIRKRNGDVLAATGKVVVVVFDWTLQRSVRLPDVMRERIREHQEVSGG